MPTAPEPTSAGELLRSGRKRGSVAKQRYTAYRANPTTYMVNDSHARKRAADIRAGAKKAADKRA